jgi:hypothetical protein
MKRSTVNLSLDPSVTCNVEVTEGDEPTRPAGLEALNEFPKIQNLVDEEWGTVRLKEYLEKLLADTRSNSRTGFPKEFADGLLRLTLANDKALEKRGVDAQDWESQFAATGWQLPRNF